MTNARSSLVAAPTTSASFRPVRFVGNRVDVVAECDERILGRDGDVLVELELHVLGVSGRTSCLASHGCL